MAIKSITIENFKGIGDAVTVPIRPITLLFGKNSSGKSTVLKALAYMLHVIKYNDPNPHHLMGRDTDLTDVGSFLSFVHLKDSDRKIAIRIEFEVKCENQLGWVEIKTGWDLKKDNAYTLSRKIGIGDDEWEYDDKLEYSEDLRRMECLKASLIEELEGFRLLGPIRKVPSRELKELRFVLKIPLGDEDTFKVRIGQVWDGLEPWAIILRDNLRDGQLTDKINSQMGHLKLGCEIAFREDYVPTITVGDLKKELDKIGSDILKNKNPKYQVSHFLRQLPRQRTFRLSLKGKENPIHLDLLDVGSGIGQIIPVLVGVLEDSYRTFAVTEPELHVHPAVQVGLGDLFIDGIQNSNRTFLIETHSEHLLLRLLRRVRETTRLSRNQTTELERTDHKLTPDDLSVVYVRPTQAGVKYTPLTVTNNGDFDAPWPEGFFEERESEWY